MILASSPQKGAALNLGPYYFSFNALKRTLKIKKKGAGSTCCVHAIPPWYIVY